MARALSLYEVARDRWEIRHGDGPAVLAGLESADVPGRRAIVAAVRVQAPGYGVTDLTPITWHLERGRSPADVALGAGDTLTCITDGRL